MAEYLLPCSCGEKTVVSTAQAGEMVRCAACDAVLNVPNMRGMRELEPAVAMRRNGTRKWEDTHRVAFLLVLVGLFCLGVAAFLWMRLPAERELPPPEQLTAAVENSPPGALYQVYKDMQSGLEATPVVPDEVQRIRRSMQWGMGIAVALATGAIACAVILVLGGRKQASGTN